MVSRNNRSNLENSAESRVRGWLTNVSLTTSITALVAMSMPLVIFPAPLFNQYLGFGQGCEDLAIQNFSPQLSITPLYVYVLLSTSRS